MDVHRALRCEREKVWHFMKGHINMELWMWKLTTNDMQYLNLIIEHAKVQATIAKH